MNIALKRLYVPEDCLYVPEDCLNIDWRRGFPEVQVCNVHVLVTA